eukprot:TRINITY_DN14089_c0_g2_i5.p2 TRINITY_DN14089_c0_g2~~TRINITY_DN14089_c0_g2_i5.p2  ORF type:complete len:327 (-),score=25.86 TRINITY_DN14089_c0_g2_i5:1078-2058(-)
MELLLRTILLLCFIVVIIFLGKQIQVLWIYGYMLGVVEFVLFFVLTVGKTCTLCWLFEGQYEQSQFLEWQGQVDSKELCCSCLFFWEESQCCRQVKTIDVVSVRMEDQEKLSKLLEDGDFVLQSSDSVEFKVHRSVLGVHSCVFRELFNATSGNIVSIKEDSLTIQDLLTYIYPIKRLRYGNQQAEITIEDVVRLVLIADKYSIQILIEDADEFLETALAQNNLLQKDICPSSAWHVTANTDSSHSLVIYNNIQRGNVQSAVVLKCIRWAQFAERFGLKLLGRRLGMTIGNCMHKDCDLFQAGIQKLREVDILQAIIMAAQGRITQ